MNRMRQCSLIVAMSVMAWPLYAADGVLIVEKTTSGSSVQSSQIQIEPTRMRVESISPAGEKQVFVFDGTKQVLWMISPDKKSYSEMTKADVDRMGTQMAGAMAMMQEQMKNMPPEQRAQMEAMMRGRGMPGLVAAASKTEYRKVDTDKVGKWTCDKYEGYQNNQKVSEVCTVNPQALGFSAADFGVTRQLADFFRQLMPQNADNLFAMGKPEDQGFSGIPVKRVAMAGPRQSVTELTDVSRQSFSDSLFALPPGVQKEAAPFGGRGRQ